MPWLSSCKGKERASWKVYQSMKSMSATEENLKFYVNLLFTPFDGLPNTSYNTQDVLDNIDSNSDKECLKSSILNAYCNVVYLKTAETWISKIESMKSYLSLIAEVTTQAALMAILTDVIPSVSESVFKAYAGLRSLPEIAENLYTWSIHCLN
jgi:hypothetical protein